ncbi:MAG TPA: SpoVR family protein, partial [Alphaproteobacteria bacterium]|nr:SpoVR family protein [Alphaproteobacteria bacterium]
QFATKILNEGWATYWHAELLQHYTGLTPRETIDFGVLHAGVVTPGHRLSINPYFLGYRILVDVQRRWDKLYAAGQSAITGQEKLFEIRTHENDVSLLSNYLTQELVDELDLFAYGYACEHGPQGQKRCQKCGEIAIQSRKREDVVYSLVAPRFNYGAPRITVAHVNADGSLLLEHERSDLGPLDLTYTEKTLAYLHELWKKPVHLKTFNSRNEATTLTYSAAGIEVGR